MHHWPAAAAQLQLARATRPTRTAAVQQTCSRDGSPLTGRGMSEPPLPRASRAPLRMPDGIGAPQLPRGGIGALLLGVIGTLELPRGGIGAPLLGVISAPPLVRAIRPSCCSSGGGTLGCGICAPQLLRGGARAPPLLGAPDQLACCDGVSPLRRGIVAPKLLRGSAGALLACSVSTTCVVPLATVVDTFFFTCADSLGLRGHSFSDCTFDQFFDDGESPLNHSGDEVRGNDLLGLDPVVTGLDELLHLLPLLFLFDANTVHFTIFVQ